MSIKKQNQIDELPRLRTENYENIFSVNLDQDNRYFYNLLQTIKFPDNLPKNFYKTYITKTGDTYPFISYKVYNTPNLWWVITAFNKIDNPIPILEPGVVLNIPVFDVVRSILTQTSKI